MLEILVNWIIISLAILATSHMLSGVVVSNFTVSLIVALVLGLLNSFIKPFLLFLTLPINIFTLGLFVFVINAVLVLLTAALVPGFRVRGFWQAFLFSIILAVFIYLINLIFR